MRKSDITQRVIDLAKQIAEHWRMEIYEGAWVRNNYGTPCLELVTKTHLKLYLIKRVTPEKHWFPIPSISDVLLKLQESDMAGIWVSEGLVDCYKYDEDKVLIYQFQKRGKNLLEALLSALLEALRK